MQINKEADFILRGDGEVIYPEISKDGLEMYYDVKGKKNGDVHKDKLLDMSGQGKDGELSGFDYDGELSGYDGDNGLVFDGIEDTLELGEVEGVEVVSATRNLCRKNTFTGTVSKITETMNTINKVVEYNVPISPNNTYTLSGIMPPNLRLVVFATTTKVAENRTTHDQMYTHVFGSGIGIQINDYKVPVGYNYVTITTGGSFGNNYHSVGSSVTWSNIQLEEGSTATPYVPYIPTAKMTYQLNNNVISYGEGGMVKWVKDGKVMERKGINTATNSTFYTGNHSGFNRNTGDVSISGGIATFRQDTAGSNSHAGFYRRPSTFNLEEGDIALISIEVKPEHNVGLRLGLGSRIKYFSDLKENQWNRREVVLENINSQHTIFYYDMSSKYEMGDTVEFRNIQVVNLTATFGAGNEPTLEEIQANPDKWQWLPSPMDLLEAKELGGNILGDMEDIVDASPRDRQSGKEVFTEHADDSHVGVEVDGKSSYLDNSILTLDKLGSYDPYNTAPTYDENTDTIAFTYLNPSSYKLIAVNNLASFKGDRRYIVSGYAHINGSPLVWEYRTLNSDAPISNVHSFHTNSQTGYFEVDQTYTTNWLLHTTIEGAEPGDTITIRNFKAVPVAPHPDMPKELHSLNDFDVVSSVGGRNYLRNSDLSLGTEFWSGGGGSLVDGGLLLEGTSRDSSLVQNITEVPEGEYTLQVWYEVLEGQAPYLFNYGGSDAQWTDEYPFLVDKEYLEVGITIRSSNLMPSFRYAGSSPANHLVGKTLIKRVKLEKGNKATPWTPAPEDITPDTDLPLIDKINLNLSEPLRSVGDVKDRIYKDGDGLWKIERNVREVGLKETGRGWSTDSYEDEGYNYAYFRPVNFKAHGEVQSNILPQGAVYDNTKETLGKTVVITFNLKDSRTGVTSTDNADNRVVKIRNYLMSIEGAMVSYELATPTTETLDQELQDKLNTLKSFKDSNYVYAVQNTDNPHKEQLKPTLHATFNSKDYLKETRTLTNLLIWARELTDGELIHHNQLFLNRFNLPSDRVIGEPIEQTLNLLHGGMVGHSLEQNYTINI